MPTPRIAAIHDLSGFGRCALTIVIPVLSAMGVQCCPLPTALLSTHTGGFQGNTFLDLTDQMAPVTAHWQACRLTFDAVYTGFMGSREQMALTADFIRAFRPCLAVVDPVMGDNGRAYRTYTPDMCRAMRRLAEDADIVTPNRTEAAILLDVPYADLRLDTEADCRRWAEALSLGGRRSVVLTGALPESRGQAGAVCFDRASGKTDIAAAPLAQAAVLLATAPKSNSVCAAIGAARADVRRGRTGSIPRGLQNVHADTAGQEREQGYLYPHDFPGHWVRQQYLPDELAGTVYYRYGDNKTEQAAQAYWEKRKS